MVSKRKTRKVEWKMIPKALFKKKMRKTSKKKMRRTKSLLKKKWRKTKLMKFL